MPSASSWRTGLAPGEEQTSVDGLHCSGDVLVLHEVDVCGGDLLRFADRSGQCAPSQAGKERLSLDLGDTVPERGAKGAGSDRIDADGGETALD